MTTQTLSRTTFPVRPAVPPRVLTFDPPHMTRFLLTQTRHWVRSLAQRSLLLTEKIVIALLVF
jgi:hypothetical protein